MCFAIFVVRQDCHIVVDAYNLDCSAHLCVFFNLFFCVWSQLLQIFCFVLLLSPVEPCCQCRNTDTSQMHLNCHQQHWNVVQSILRSMQKPVSNQKLHVHPICNVHNIILYTQDRIYAHLMDRENEFKACVNKVKMSNANKTSHTHFHQQVGDKWSAPVESRDKSKGWEIYWEWRNFGECKDAN